MTITRALVEEAPALVGIALFISMIATRSAIFCGA
jgi:hypothetical protein